MREIIHLSCTSCKRKNYTTKKNKKKHTEKLEIKKYCSFCKTHVLHKESK